MNMPMNSPMRGQYAKAKRALANCARMQHHHGWSEGQWRRRMLWHKEWVRILEGQWRAYKHEQARTIQLRAGCTQ